MKTLELSNERYARIQLLLKRGGNKTLDDAVRWALRSLPTQSHGAIQLYGVIDLHSALNGNVHSQEDWMEFYNLQKDEAQGKHMITAPDIYRAGKDGSDELLASLRKDFDARWIVTGTRILYNVGDLTGKVVHNYNSTVVKPIEIAVSEIPEYHQANIKEAVEGRGLVYVKALFQTQDKPTTIIKTLEHLSRKSASDIKLWTPYQNSRKNYPERAVGFGFNDGRFHVFGDYWDDCDFGSIGYGDGYDGRGRSRGVSVRPRSGRAT